MLRKQHKALWLSRLNESPHGWVNRALQKRSSIGIVYELHSLLLQLRLGNRVILMENIWVMAKQSPLASSSSAHYCWEDFVLESSMEVGPQPTILEPDSVTELITKRSISSGNLQTLQATAFNPEHPSKTQSG